MKIKHFFYTLVGSAIALPATSQSLQEAITQTENERFDLAGASFRKLLAKDATKAETYFYYGENFYYSNKLDSAQMMYKKGADLQATNGLNYVGLGKIQLQQGNVTDGNANLFKAKTLGAKNASVLVALANAYINAPQGTQNLNEAVALLDNALKIDAKNADAHIFKGDALLALHPTEGAPAIKEYEEAQKLNPKSAKAVLRQGKLWKRSRNYQLALDKYKEAVKIEPNFAPTYIEMAELYHMANQDNNAVESAKKYLELNGNNLHAKERYAGFLLENKQYAEVIQQINEIQKQDASNVYLYRYAGYSYDELGNKTDTAAFTKGLSAINTFFTKTANQKFEYVPEDFKHKASLLAKTGKDSLAALELQKAIDMEPSKHCDLYSDMGKVWMKAKRYTNAISAYEKKGACAKQSAQDLYELGRAYYYGPKDFVKADTAFSHLILASPPSYPLGYFWRARVKTQLDPKNETWLAKPDYEKGLELVKPEERGGSYKANIIEACSYLGFYYVKNKDNTKAKEYWEIVQQLEPTNDKAKAFFKSVGK